MVLTFLCVKLKVLNWVRDQAEKESDLQQYVPHLQGNTILRLLQQVMFGSLLSECYWVVKVLNMSIRVTVPYLYFFIL